MKHQATFVLTLMLAASAQARQLTISKQEVTKQAALGAVANVTIKGHQEQVLTDSNGLTVYTFDKDVANQSACTGACLTEWPPVHVPANVTPLPPFGQISGNDGQPQLTLQGFALYHYDDDKKPGDAFGVYPLWEAVLATSTTSFSASTKAVTCKGENNPYTVTFNLADKVPAVGEQIKIHELLDLSNTVGGKMGDEYYECEVTKTSAANYECDFQSPSFDYKLTVQLQNGRPVSAHEESGGCGMSCSESKVDYVCQ